MEPLCTAPAYGCVYAGHNMLRYMHLLLCTYGTSNTFPQAAINLDNVPILKKDFNSLHADYAIAREKSLGRIMFTRALVVAMPSGKECDSYPLDERRLK